MTMGACDLSFLQVGMGDDTHVAVGKSEDSLVPVGLGDDTLVVTMTLRWACMMVVLQGGPAGQFARSMPILC